MQTARNEDHIGQAKAATHRIDAPLGAVPGAWQAELERAFAIEPERSSAIDPIVEPLSRAAGPALFAVLLTAVAGRILGWL